MLHKNKKINIDLFNKILKSGKKKDFNYFYIIYIKDEKQKNSHITFVAPKKQFKKAVDRNNIKRKCFYIINKLYSSIPSSSNIIFFLRKEITKLDFKEKEKEIKDSLLEVN